MENQEKKEVTNLSEALGVLIQATDKGRIAGIYNWDDLLVLSKTLKYIESITKKGDVSVDETTKD